MKSRWHNAAQYIVLPVASVCVAVLMLEVFLRVTGWQPDFFFQPDPDISMTYIAGKQGWHVFAHRRQWIEINSFGYRDREWTVQKPPGTVRIALLGDSYVAGMEVPVQQRLGEVLEKRLNDECGGTRRYEVLNFGVTGYGTAQELETLRRRTLQFHPDLVVLFVYTGNDLFDNSRELDPEPNRLHYALDGSGALVRLPFRIRDSAIKRWLRAHSRAYNFIRDRIFSFQAVHRAIVNFGFMQDAASPVAMQNALERLQNSQNLKQAPAAIERAWEITKALISEAQRLAAGNGAAFGVVIVPMKQAIQNVPPAGAADGDHWDMEQPLRKMDWICRNLGVGCLQLVGAFRAADVSIEECFYAEGHWTPKGHAVAARATFDWIRRIVCPQYGTAAVAQAQR